MPMIRVAVIEDHAGQRESLVDLLSGGQDFVCVGACATAEEAIARLPECRPDLVLVDIHLSGTDGIQAIRRLRSMLPGLQFLVLSVDDDPKSIFAALQAGADGYLLKRHSPERILAAIKEIHVGGAPMSPQVARLVVQSLRSDLAGQTALEKLTPRELEVLGWLAKGWRYKEVAAKLEVRLGTIEGYVRSIYRKLQVHSAVEAAEILRQSPHG